MPSTWSSSSSGCDFRFCPWGGTAWKPAAIAGTTSMKMMRSTSITSIIGVTFGSALTPLPPPMAMELPPSWVRGGRLLRDRAGAAGGGRVELAGEARAAEVARDALDEVVDHLLRRVRHLGRQVVDLGREVVERPHGRDRDEQTEGGRDERLGDAGRDRGQTAGARRGHARERVHDAHRGAEEADERRGGTDRGEHA